jgi:hypothetical protein
MFIAAVVLSVLLAATLALTGFKKFRRTRVR